jgi:superfamily I DNA/RNA helicase
VDQEARWDEGLEGAALRIAATEETPLRVCAGPGTGKSRALRHRVKRLLQEGFHPGHIFLVTFTRNAAAELRKDLESLETQGASQVVSGTLHSFCFKSLASGEIPGSGGRFARPLMDFEEGFLRVDLKRPGRGIRDIKRMLKAFKADWARLQHEEPGWPTDPADNAFHADMIAWLKFHRAMLIGELPGLMRRYLELHPLAPARTVFEHVLVDEYQDLNRADQAVIDLLSQIGTLTIIGDEDQTIYTELRHAQPESIRDFPLTHPGTHDEMMEVCYRCPTTVVDMASHLIRFNDDREERALLPSRDNDAGNVAIVQWETMQDEIAGLTELIKLHKERTPHPRDPERTIDWNDIVVLTPRELHGTDLTAALNAAGIPAHSYFSPKALASEEAQRRYTLLTLLARPDDRVGLRCLVGFGLHEKGAAPYRGFREHCEQQGRDPFDVMGDLAAGRIAIRGTAPLVERWRAFEDERNQIRALTDQPLVDALFPQATTVLSEVRELAIEVLEEQGEGVTASKLIEELGPKIYSPEAPVDVDCVR